MTTLNVLLDSKDEAKVEAIKKAVGSGSRKVFDSYADAKKAFDAAVAAADGSIPSHAFPEEVFGEHEITVGEGEDEQTISVLTRAVVGIIGARQRVEGKDKMESGIKGIALFPLPDVNAFIMQAGPWVSKIVEKEASHVAFRGLRNAETAEAMAGAFESMPQDVAAYVTEYARGDSIDTEAYDLVWKDFRAALKEAMPKLVELLPTKGDVLKALRSASFAKSDYPELESRGIFTYLGNELVKVCANNVDGEGNPAPIDSSAIAEWLKERDETHLAGKKPTDDALDFLDSLNLGMAD